MEASSSATCSGRKRENVSPPAHRKTKILKTEEEAEEVLLCGRTSSSSPRVSVRPDRLQQPITLKELTELLHYAALGKTGGIRQTSWCRLHRQRKVVGVNVVIMEGLTQSHFYKHYLTLQHLRTNYSTRVTFTPSSDNVASGIFSIEVPEVDCLSASKPDNDIRPALRSHPVIAKFGTQRKGLTAYVFTQQEMIQRHFPVKGMPGFEEFVCTESINCVTDSSPLFGVDCEMCLTEKGYELTHVSLVDSDGTCVLNELVKPMNCILDYLTQFSGITAAMLRRVTTTLKDVQEKLRKLLPCDAVLVGHSLNNDLKALKLIHQHVIDTSLLYKKDFGQRFKLKVLAEEVLRRQIQTEERRGHDPTEDALAALELAQYFIKTGPRQVVELHPRLWGFTIEEEAPDCTPASAPAPAPSPRFADILQTLGRSVSFLGKRSDIALDLTNQRWYSSDRELLKSFRSQTKNPFLSVLQLSSFSDHLKRHSLHPEQQYLTVGAHLRDMCVVFAGPFPERFSNTEVRRLFRCCGPIRRIEMLDESDWVLHAKIEFELLEGAVLALRTLDGLDVQGQSIKVQRPASMSMLDLDLTLDALMADPLNATHLYAVKRKPSRAEHVNVSAKVNGHASDAECSGVPPVQTANGQPLAQINGKQLQLTTTSKLSEEAVTETFGRFGAVKEVILSVKPVKHARHTCRIGFQSSEAKHAAVSSSDDLRTENYLISPSLTPTHLPSWVGMTTPVAPVDADGTAAEGDNNSSQDKEMDLVMKKLDRRLKKLFRSLPGGTLSVVLLPGHFSANGHLPGLCLMEVIRGF
ncbi:RNA exonuclease 5-like [Embiotoca jacksoni]|uniref:RNA exonuclease 5-like n=1 Tax=Embiotoca jacksoni TaxID=100190 RepID=UPI003703FCD2